MRTVLLTLLLLVAASCQTRTAVKEEPVGRIGKYLYMDFEGCIHTRSRCLALRGEGNMPYAVQFIDTASVKQTDLEWFCSRCVDDAAYERIMDMAGHDEWEGVR